MFKLGLVVAGASVASGQAADLVAYCDQLVVDCKTQHNYADSAACQNAMGAVTVGTLTDVDVDTIGCRQRFLTDGTVTQATKCQYAGTTGGGKCGGDLVKYACRAMTTACAGLTPISYSTAAACETGLAPLAAQWGAKQGALAAGEDTIECRVYHALVGAGAGAAGVGNPPVFHCDHFSITGSPCNAGAPVPDKTHYCEIITSKCTGTEKQYGSPDPMASCMNSAAAFPNVPLDARASNTMNSLGCREYHAQAVVSDPGGPTVHCQHAGPSGGGACGTYAQAWGSLNLGVCSTNDTNALLGIVGQAALDTALPKKTGTAAYSSVIDTTMNTQTCRIYHLTVAAASAALAAAHCSHGSVDGAGNCGASYSDNLCEIIGNVCGFGTASYQWASRSACNSSLSAIAVGSFADRTTNTLGCRLYHVGVAASYLPGGASGADTTMLQTHCNHVLLNTNAGGCNAAAAPTNAAPTNAAAPTNKPAAPTNKSNAASLSCAFAFAVAVGSLFF